MNCIKVIYTSYNEKGNSIGSTFPISILFKIDVSNVDFVDLPESYHYHFLMHGWCRVYNESCSYYAFDLDNLKIKDHICFTELRPFILSYQRNKIISELDILD